MVREKFWDASISNWAMAGMGIDWRLIDKVVGTSDRGWGRTVERRHQGYRIRGMTCLHLSSWATWHIIDWTVPLTEQHISGVRDTNAFVQIGLWLRGTVYVIYVYLLGRGQLG